MENAQIFHWEVSTEKTGLPFQEFRLFRKTSSGTNQKVVFHLQPDRNFRNFLVNGKRSRSPGVSITIVALHFCPAWQTCLTPFDQLYVSLFLPMKMRCDRVF